jgi:predicted ester cyclase
MSIEANKTALRRAVTNFSAATLDAYLNLYHPQAALHFLPPGLPPGREGARLFYQGFLAAFPDAQITLEDFVAEEDKLASRFTLQGTHRGEFMGVAATGKRVSISGITILRFVEGQCVERWSEANFVGLLQQLGALPG